jgi:hypothetical protein
MVAFPLHFRYGTHQLGVGVWFDLVWFGLALALALCKS